MYVQFISRGLSTYCAIILDGCCSLLNTLYQVPGVVLNQLYLGQIKKIQDSFDTINFEVFLDMSRYVFGAQSIPELNTSGSCSKGN